jgi:hypothetical protein
LTQVSTAKPEMNKVNAPMEKMDSVTGNPNKAAQSKGDETEKEKADREKAKIREMTGNVVKTGLGTIIKYPDGSFESIEQE